MTALWTGADIARATGGRLLADFAATGVSIDTRTLAPGDLFVALNAARDGHDFVAQALAAGAAGALVSRIPEGVSPDAPLVVVADVLAGLGALGAAARARSTARVIGVTGSVGKTSTKEMLRAILDRQGQVHAAEASYNNHWGVPLTLARMPADADFAVIEIGMNHPGEIAPLARLARPHVALITTVAPAHLAAFDGIEAIALEKASIFEGLEPGGTAVIPADLPETPILAAAADAVVDGITIRFGRDPSADWRMGVPQVVGEVMVVRAEGPAEPVLARIASAGRHFALNGLGALAAALAAGADPALSSLGLGDWRPGAGRGARLRVPLDLIDEAEYFELIDDAYNANPVSLGAALDLLAACAPRHGIGRIEKGRRIAILGDMLELGEDEIALHAGIAAHPAMASVDLLHCIGPRMRALWEALPPARRGEWFATSDELAREAHHLVDAGDIVLVKGSLGTRLAPVVDALRNLGQGHGPGARADA